MSGSPETFGYEPDENGDICFRTLYTDFKMTDYDESYREFVRGVMQFAEPGIMPIYRPGAEPEGWHCENPE